MIAEQASADFERIWALSHVALGYFGTAGEFEQLDRCFQEALDKGYAIADQIHNAGQAIVWSGHQELAELYWEQLCDAKLTMAPLESC